MNKTIGIRNNKTFLLLKFKKYRNLNKPRLI